MHTVTTRNRCTYTEDPEDPTSRQCRFASGHSGAGVRCLFDPDQPLKRGEWDCQTCAFRNAAARIDCSGCGTPKPKEAM